MKRVLAGITMLCMMIPLAACGDGGEKTSAENESKQMTVADCELLYEESAIMTDLDGDNALVSTLTYTNNGDEESSFAWAVIYEAKQGDAVLEKAYVFENQAENILLADSLYEYVPAKGSAKVYLAFKLNDLTTPVTLSFEDFFWIAEPQTVMVDISKLPVAPTAPAADEDAQAYWNGGWYGWWEFQDCTGDYAGNEGGRFDACALVTLDQNNVGLLEIWDKVTTIDNPVGCIAVRLDENAGGDYGALYSKDGSFMYQDIAADEWEIRSDGANYPDTMLIEGEHTDDGGSYSYVLCLRPWGMAWDDVEAEHPESLPDHYADWYLPLIQAHEDMPPQMDLQ